MTPSSPPAGEMPGGASANGGPPVRYRRDGIVGRITLAEPARRNAFTSRSLRLIGDAIDEALDDAAVRVLVVDAEGPAFCAGADLDSADDDEMLGLYAAVLAAMRDSTKPIVAAVQGPVVGGGNGLVASADVAVVAEDATFAFTEVRVGAVPAVVVVACLGRMRMADLRELMLTGERFDAVRARDAGLVQRIVPGAELGREVDNVVRALAQGSPAALAVTRQLLRDLPTMEEDEAFRWAASISAEMFSAADAREGRAARSERRAPRWVPGDASG